MGLLVTLWVLTALLYPALRRSTAWFVDTVVLHRPNYPSLRASVSRRIQAHDEIELLLSDLCEQFGPALSARRVEWRERTGRSEDVPGVVANGDGLMALLPTAEAPRYEISIGEVTGGRRLLSDDVTTLEALTSVAARRIDAIRMTNERYDREIREQEMKSSRRKRNFARFARN